MSAATYILWSCEYCIKNYRSWYATASKIHCLWGTGFPFDLSFGDRPDRVQWSEHQMPWKVNVLRFNLDLRNRTVSGPRVEWVLLLHFDLKPELLWISRMMYILILRWTSPIFSPMHTVQFCSICRCLHKSVFASVNFGYIVIFVHLYSRSLLVRPHDLSKVGLCPLWSKNHWTELLMFANRYRIPIRVTYIFVTLDSYASRTPWTHSVVNSSRDFLSLAISYFFLARTRWFGHMSSLAYSVLP